MDIRYKEKLEALTRVFDNNYKITNLYATYLERFPEAINAEMVTALTEDSDISEKEAIVAILSELFALDFSRREDRELIKDYISRSVRVLDKERYTENPYAKNLKIPPIKDGSWELRYERYPAYRAVICDDMIADDDFVEVPPLGFFKEDFEFLAVLEEGNEWMTLTPVDLDTCTEAIDRAKGRVITFGLGLGYYAYMVSEKECVQKITVVEKSKEVIELFKKHILPRFPHKEKVEIICADAFEFAEREMPKRKFDLAFVDTWRDASDGAPMYRRMKALEELNKGTSFMYWIEGFLVSRLRAERFEELLSAVENQKDGAPQSYEEFTEQLSNLK